MFTQKTKKDERLTIVFIGRKRKKQTNAFFFIIREKCNKNSPDGA